MALSRFQLTLLLPFVTIPILTSALTTVAPTSSASTFTITLALPTTIYTGQALLTGTCATPIYSTLHFADPSGSGQNVIEVPLIGCSDDRLECCPSLQWPKWSSHSTWTGSKHPSSTTTISSTATDGKGFASPTATGIVSALNGSPLSVCPSDFVNLSPVCCPTGYSLYPTALYGRVTPCWRSLETPISVPSQILASISSVVAGDLTSGASTLTTSASRTTTSAAQTVEVVVNQVFALGLPCAVAGDFSYHGLSSGAKAGIGVSLGIAALVGALVFTWWYWCMRTRKGVIGDNQISMNVLRVGIGKDDRRSHIDGDEERSGLVGPRPKYSSGVSELSISTMRGAEGLMSPPLDSAGNPGYAQGYMHGVHAVAQYQQDQLQEEALLPAYHELGQGRDTIVEAGGSERVEMGGSVSPRVEAGAKEFS